MPGASTTCEIEGLLEPFPAASGQDRIHHSLEGPRRERCRQLPALEPCSRRGSGAASRRCRSRRGKLQLFDAIGGFWQRAAARQPLLLVLDDLHGADVPSLRLLEFVARESATSRLLLLGTFRDAEVTRTHPLSDTLGTLARQAGTQRLKLGGFSEDETARFVEAVSGSPAAGLAAAMHERTEGHPLFLAEMARLLEETRVAARCDRRPASGAGRRARGHRLAAEPAVAAVQPRARQRRA